VSAGCLHCYAELVAARFSGPGQPYEGLARRRSTGEPQWTGAVRFFPEHLDQPLRWRRPRKIFVNSMSDLFHEELSDAVIDQVFAVMALAQRHTFQVLTKRPARMLAYVKGLDGEIVSRLGEAAFRIGGDALCEQLGDLAVERIITNPWHPLTEHVWLGVSVEDQATADERIALLLETPAAVRFLSCEPLLGPIQFPLPCKASRFWGGIHWAIIGGESGPGYRAMDMAWLESIVDQCRAAGVPVWVKQDSGARPGHQGRIPDALRLHEFPAAPAVRA
jgi:protein gp37